MVETGFRAICARIEGNELIAPECVSLTGGEPDEEGIAECYQIDKIANSAYVRLGMHMIAEAFSLDELVQKIIPLSLSPPSFRINFLNLTTNRSLHKNPAIKAISDAIYSAPDLKTPDTQYLLVSQESKIWLGEVSIQNRHNYKQHDNKPFRISSSLPSRLARALVNLVIGQAESILDPFCGSGSILLEAQALGLQAYGMDLNPKMTGMTRKNLDFFNYSAVVEQGDAGKCKMKADAIVTDLPYGRLLLENQNYLCEILPHLRRLAPVSVYVSERNISEWMEQAGYRDIKIYKVKKREGMCRVVHIGYS
jgi:tRNA (guanine10-N2)-dimethyltransferase